MARRLSALGRKKLAIAALQDIKARDILAIEVRRLTTVCDWILIATADSARQTRALARHVRERLLEAGARVTGVEGEEGGEWVLVDAGDVVVHILQPATRALYDLEELWSEGRHEAPVNPSVPVAPAGRPRRARP